MENFIKSQMNDNFNLEVFKAISSVRNKQGNVESIFE